MNKFINSNIGRLRSLAILEGLSLLVLVFVSVPLKYIYGITQLSTVLGPIHGILFLLFVFNTISVGTEYDWKFKETTWKVLLACIIPFGTFYIDHKILKPLHKITGQ
jgi:integral membrane protein